MQVNKVDSPTQSWALKLNDAIISNVLLSALPSNGSTFFTGQVLNLTTEKWEQAAQGIQVV